ncbi:UDP-glucose 4-epimerase [Pseudomonas asuensis]|uniref:UDP-glucose 4-epimerase n=1 Tax=Pseudomonas asuensis TaxID=1825787 RepID=A0ABQ2GN03_9PSED|nr:SDR family oxidoreductase [Pseudomonas asuensis]GGM03153.1 UDP-glucose 4-epimerase [Pseudomonas asuensis]
MQDSVAKIEACGVLVTGAGGFVGRAIVQQLIQQGIPVRAVVRRSRNSPGLDELVRTIDGDTCWADAFEGVSTIIHAAARVHVMRESVNAPEDEFYRVNVAGTLNLAEQAISAGVKRLIFLSSIKVNGDFTQPGVPFTADDAPCPSDAYARTKLQAEKALLQLGERSGLEVVIIRPPLVYGPDVKANFKSMLKWTARGVPLPLGAIYNRRSLVSLDNLVDLICLCIKHPAASGNVFLVSDGEDLSTTELLCTLAQGMSRSPRLIPIPANWLIGIAHCIGRKDLAIRLCASLQVDIYKTSKILGWVPPYKARQALSQVAQAYLESNN